MADLSEQLRGPVLVLGSTGFIGSNLLKYLHARRIPALGGDRQQGRTTLKMAKPNVVFNCIGYGSDKYETSTREMQITNNLMVQEIVTELYINGKPFTFINAGSSSEYGESLMAPRETTSLYPSTPYGASKAAAAIYLHQEGKWRGGRVANLRLYNVYGPGDHSDTLVSTVVSEGKRGRLPEFTNAATNRDFIHVDDVCQAFVCAAVNLKEEHYGESFNIGGDVRTLAEVAKYAKSVFKIESEPKFDNRAPVQRWCSDSRKAEQHLGFKSGISLLVGLKRLAKGKI